MPNTTRKRSEYLLMLSKDQLSALLDLAKKRDEPMDKLLLEALDEFIENEKRSCQN